ncbi:MAG: Rrf2 family transcriptional regulator [Alphaproteobacteria bacterium]|nr:Rrf2 family transcriptional regulator [Alphaproteobacteria bacterium]
MRLTVYTDYGLRLLMYVALKSEGLTTIQEVADAYGISKNHLMKVAYDLGRHGVLETVRGRGGGLKLARAAEKIRLGDVVRKMEEDFTMVECFAPDSSHCRIEGPCRLRHVLQDALKAYLGVLDRYTLADLTMRNAGLAKLLFADA